MMICGLCLNSCENFERLYNTNGSRKLSYQLIYDYFHPKYINMNEAQHLTVICLKCWHQITDFNSFQATINMAQLNLIDDEKFFKENRKTEEPFTAELFKRENFEEEPFTAKLLKRQNVEEPVTAKFLKCQAANTLNEVILIEDDEEDEVGAVVDTPSNTAKKQNLAVVDNTNKNPKIFVSTVQKTTVDSNTKLKRSNFSETEPDPGNVKKSYHKLQIETWLENSNSKMAHDLLEAETYKLYTKDTVSDFALKDKTTNDEGNIQLEKSNKATSLEYSSLKDITSGSDKNDYKSFKAHLKVAIIAGESKENDTKNLELASSISEKVIDKRCLENPYECPSCHRPFSNRLEMKDLSITAMKFETLKKFEIKQEQFNDNSYCESRYDDSKIFKAPTSADCVISKSQTTFKDCDKYHLQDLKVSIKKCNILDEMAIQEPNRPLFQCNFCPARFVMNCQLKKHCELQHWMPIDAEGNIFKCRVCVKSYTTCKLLRRHMALRHWRYHSTLFKCDLCKEIYVTEQELKEHKSRLHC